MFHFFFFLSEILRFLLTDTHWQPLPSALEQGAHEGRLGKGSIYVWSAGNGGYYGDSCAYDGFVSSKYTIAIGSVDQFGVKSYYSEGCSALLAVTPSSGNSMGITTTDRTPPYGYDETSSCTSRFGGTSSSAPLASGLIALLLQHRSDLTWRDVQAILLLTSTQTDPEDDDWQANGAGHLVNHKYGFGVIDISNAIDMATDWTLLDKYTFFDSGVVTFNEEIPLDPEEGFSHIFTVSLSDTISPIYPDPSRIEHVEVVVTVKHPQRNKLTISLTSPHDTVSVLSEPHMVGLIPTLFFDYPDQVAGLYFNGNATGFGPSLANPTRGRLITLKGGCEKFESGLDLNGAVFLLRLNQSKCSPATQVYNAQFAGAVAVVFIPDYYGPLHLLNVSSVDTSAIAIPSMQLDPYLGSQIFDYFVEKQDIRLVVRVQSIVFPQHDYSNYPFLSMRHWGETAVGEWTVKITDFPSDESSGGDGVKGVVKSLALRLYGRGFVKEFIYEPPKTPPSRTVLLWISFLLVSLAVGSIAAVYYYSHMTKVERINTPEQNYDPMSIDTTMSDVVTEDDEHATL